MKTNPRTCPNLISIGHLRKVIFSTNHKNLVVYFSLLVLFVVEVVIYLLTTFSWHSIDCYWKSECTRILLVADPQLIGLHNEHSNLLTPFSIWDSDRYLSKTFSLAFEFAQPDVVIFLGDLFDEGSTATDEEFKTYLRRLFSIFLKSSYPAVHHIWLPGDNDIGGEFNDRITPHKVKRFEQAFSQPDNISIKNLKFLKINRLTGTVPKIARREDFSNLDNIVVGVSHIPLLMSPASFVDKPHLIPKVLYHYLTFIVSPVHNFEENKHFSKVLDKLRPHLLLTAHTHKSMIVSTQEELRRDRLITPISPNNNQVFEYFLGVSDIYEILVPTCSYRMGTDKIGYGLAVVESGSLRYTVLWTPSRFRQLFFYGFVIVCGLAYLLCCRCRKCGSKDNAEQYTRIGRIP